MFRKKIIVLLLFLFPELLHSQRDDFSDTGKASFYHDKFEGRQTSNGEEYNQDDFTAAHRTLPFNTILYVTNKQNNRSVVVRVNDRGPFKKSRIIDLTKSAAMKLQMIPFGVVPVKIRPLTFLDRPELTDSSIGENETRDCFSQKVVLHDSCVMVWQTEFIKHAFYVASDLLLSYQLENVFVKALGSGTGRRYRILIPCVPGSSDSKKLVRNLRKDGFLHAKIIR